LILPLPPTGEQNQRSIALESSDNKPPSTASSGQAGRSTSARTTTNLVTLVFTDVVGSTSLKQTVGDRAGAAMLEEHDRIIREILAEFPRGQEIGTAGDSFFCAFTTPSEAVKFALVVQSRLRAFNENREHKIADRVGIHLGEVVVKDPETRLQSKDLYGLSLDTCARVMGLAEGGRILMTRPVFDSARSMLRREEIPGLTQLVWQNHGRYHFKGLEEPIEVCEVAEASASDFETPASQEKATRIEENTELHERPWPPPTGSKLIDRYEVSALIGSGGMGAVYRGRDLNLDRPVALKFIPRDMASSKDRIERFKREAKALASLSHPNVITVYSVEETQGRLFIVMELVDGKSLNDLIPAEGMGIDAFLSIAIPLVEALQAAHSHGVIHRDLKPSNIMITSGNRVKVIDFGLAKLIPTNPAAEGVPLGSPVTGDLSLLGTPAYMSPEQAQGLPLDARSDIFSIGIIFYEMIAGRGPFQGESSAAIVSAILRDTPPSLSLIRRGLPERLASLIAGCLEKDLSRRCASVDVVLNALRQVKPQSSTVQSARPVEELRAASATPIRRRPGLARVMAMVVLLIAAGSFFKSRFAKVAAKSGPPKTDARSQTPPSIGGPRFIPPQPVLVSSETEEWPALSPDGKKLAFIRRVDGFHQVFLASQETEGQIEQLTKEPRDHIQPCWSADGKLLAYSCGTLKTPGIRPSDVWGGFYHPSLLDIWIHDFARGKDTLFIEEAANPKFSRDGSLAYCKVVEGGSLVSRIWTCDQLGHQRRPLTEDTDSADHFEPTWSPDGKRIAYRRQPGKYTARLAVVDLDTRKSIDLTDDLFLSDPAWSPTGKYIYFTANLSSGFNIWRIPVNPDGSKAGPLEPMTFGTGRDLHASLSHDGKTLFYTILSWNSDIWAIPFDPDLGKPSGDAFPLIASAREDTRADWSPDGRKIAFTSGK
jgi:serine/threonine protein kinase/class 3 adenylate cyclase